MTTSEYPAGSTPTGRVIARGLRRWFPLILLVGVLSFVAAMLVLGPGSTSYSSTASLELTDDVSSLISSQSKASDARREIDAQRRLIGSDENVAVLREALGSRGSSLEVLEVLAVEGGSVITVTAVASAPDVARDAAQLAVESYMLARVQSEVDEQNVQLRPLRVQRDQQLTLIDELSSELESIRATGTQSEISILEGRTADALDRLDTYNIVIQEGEFYVETADGDATIVTAATLAVERRTDSLPRALQVAVLALVASTIAAHYLHRHRGPLHLVEEVTALAGPDYPILAVVPKFDRALRKGSAALVVRSQDASPEAEAFRYLRGSIELGLHGQSRYSVAFTSAEQSEGKSVTVANYALAAARAGTDVVLVDADFLNPTVAPLFGKPARHDFARLLKGDYAPLDDPTIVTSAGRPMALITSVAATGADRLEFTSDAVGAALEKIGTQWGVVALDCPPILRVSDAATVAAAADHAVLIVRLGRTTRQSLNAALRYLEQSGANVLGIVVTHSNDSLSAYGKYEYATK